MCLLPPSPVPPHPSPTPLPWASRWQRLHYCPAVPVGSVRTRSLVAARGEHNVEWRARRHPSPALSASAPSIVSIVALERHMGTRRYCCPRACLRSACTASVRRQRRIMFSASAKVFLGSWSLTCTAGGTGVPLVDAFGSPPAATWRKGSGHTHTPPPSVHSAALEGDRKQERGFPERLHRQVLAVGERVQGACGRL